jgi:hypothetical protein
MSEVLILAEIGILISPSGSVAHHSLIPKRYERLVSSKKRGQDVNFNSPTSSYE